MARCDCIENPLRSDHKIHILRFSGLLVTAFFWYWKCKCGLGHIWRTTYSVCMVHRSLPVGPQTNGGFNKSIWSKLNSCSERNVKLCLLTWCPRTRSSYEPLSNSYSILHHNSFLRNYMKQISALYSEKTSIWYQKIIQLSKTEENGHWKTSTSVHVCSLFTYRA